MKTPTTQGEGKSLLFALSPNRVDVSASQAGANRRISFSELVALVQSEPKPYFYALRKAVHTLFQAPEQEQKQIKHSIDAIKKEFPYFLASGYCPKHHNDETLMYNGCQQVDIDLKFSGGADMANQLKVRIEELKLPFVLLCCISPSGYGVKMVVCTNNMDIKQHKAVSEQLISFFANCLAIDKTYFDVLGASQPCYVPFDSAPYILELEATPFVFEIKPVIADKPKTTFVSDDNDGLVRQAIQFLLDKQVQVAFAYHDYLRISAACVHTFGEDEGATIAFQLLENSPNFTFSNFRKNFRRHIRSFKRQGNTTATGGTLVYLAKEHGFTPFFTIKEANTTFFRGKKGDKLTTILKQENIDLTPEAITNRRWIVPTGAGKTYMVAKFAEKYKTVIVCPTLALVNDVAGQYGATKFTGDNRNISGNEMFFATTYKSFTALATRLDCSNYHVFIDEEHHLTAATSRTYMLKELTAVLRYVERDFASMTLLTGTEIYNFYEKISRLPKTVVSIPKDEKHLTFVDCEHTLFSVAEGVKRSIERGRFPVVLLNDKELKATSVKTMIDNEAVKFFNSNSKLDHFFEKITSTGIIPEEVKGIVTTTVLKEGNNIFNEFEVDFLIVGVHHSSTIEQLTSRFRNARAIFVSILKSKDRKTTTNGFDPMKYAYLLRKNTQLSCDELNTQETGDNTEMIFMEERIRQAIQIQPIQYKEESKTYEVDELELSHLVLAREAIVEYQNNDYQLKNLAKYNFKMQISTTHEDKEKQYQAFKEAIHIANKDRKRREQDEYKNELDVLENQMNAFSYAEKRMQARRITKGEKRAVTNFVELGRLGFHKDAILDILNDITSQAEFRLLKKRIILSTYKTNDEWMDKNRKLSILIKSIYHNIQEGTYPVEKLSAHLVDCLKNDKTFDLCPFLPKEHEEERYRTTLDVLRIFFNIDRIRVRIGGKKRKYLYEVRPISFSKYKINLIGQNEEEEEEYFQKTIQPVLMEVESTFKIVNGILLNRYGYPEAWDLRTSN